MKKNFSKKSLCLAAAALALTASLSVGSAMAYFTTYATAEGGVAVSLGTTVTEPQETVSDWTKHITIQNTGDYDCFVRVKVFAGSKYQSGLVFSDEDGKWSPGEGDYYYYSDVVPAGGSSGELQVKINFDYEEVKEDFNVIVAQECTRVLYNEEGNPYADWNVIVDSGQETYNDQQGEEDES